MREIVLNGLEKDFRMKRIKISEQTLNFQARRTRY